MDVSKGFGVFLYELYNDLGYQDVMMDYMLSRSYGREKVYAHMGMTYKRFFIRRYADYRKSMDRNVNFSEYSEFETKLKTFRIPTILGEMITDGYFDDEVRLRAKEKRIRLIDRDELVRLNDLRNSGTHIPLTAYRLIELLENDGFESALEYFITKNKPVDHQIRYYDANQNISSDS